MRQGMLAVKHIFELNYFINNPLGVSIDPVDSDNMTNAIMMKHLVGTLVRYANGGQFSPYLVENFKSENDGQRWTFTLRPDLQCQNGEKITAQGYIDGLSNVLRMYSRQDALPVFSHLEGWSEFEKGGNLSGIHAKSEYEVEFKFHKNIGPGFLEYLSMPYYGYFCRSNFLDGKWKSKHSIISSGPYQLEHEITDPKEVNLLLRNTWPISPKSAPGKVHFSTQLKDNSWLSKSSVLQTNLGWKDSVPEHHRQILGPPDVIRSIIMDPAGPSAFFNNVEVRKLLRNKIYEVRAKKVFSSKTAVLADAFYPGSKPEYSESSLKGATPPGTLRVFLPKSKNEDTAYAISLLKEALTDLAWKYDLYISGETPGVTSADYQSKTKFDVRVSSVVAGSVVEPWVVEMMFCSNLGVSYPDPSKRVCKYVNNLKQKSDFSILEAGAEISKIVAEDASVVPIYHGRNTWYFTDDLDVSRISGDLIIPSFEDIGWKD
ncbi:MAG: ABC transporter substrate-binding protein [Pseudobdellovibrionaceae bacterium]